MNNPKVRKVKVDVELYKSTIYCYANLKYSDFINILQSKHNFKISEDNKEVNDCAAQTIQFGKGVYVIWLERFSKRSSKQYLYMSYLVHECCHVADFIFDEHEVEPCSETFAYLVEYIFQQLYLLLKEK